MRRSRRGARVICTLHHVSVVYIERIVGMRYHFRRRFGRQCLSNVRKTLFGRPGPILPPSVQVHRTLSPKAQVIIRCAGNAVGPVDRRRQSSIANA